MFFTYKANYSVIKKAAHVTIAFALLSLIASIYVNFFENFLFVYKLFLMIGGIVVARIYWGLTDSGWFSAPLFFLQIGLLWALFYFITVNPDHNTFAMIYNRFADITYYFIIGCSVYRIRALNKLKLKKKYVNLPEEDLTTFHEELSPAKFPFHEYAENIKE